jgi:hypothetical protein
MESEYSISEPRDKPLPSSVIFISFSKHKFEITFFIYSFVFSPSGFNERAKVISSNLLLFILEINESKKIFSSGFFSVSFKFFPIKK